MSFYPARLRTVLRGTLLLLLFLLLLPSTQAQVAVQVAVRDIEVDRFPLVTAYVTAADENGRPIPNLPPSEFVLREDGRPISSFDVQTVERYQPLYVVLALDTSGSMGIRNATPLRDAKKAALTLFDTLRPDDQVALLTFAQKVTLTLDFTTDRSLLEATITATRSLPPGEGETLLYDAAFEAIRKASEGPVGNRLVILLSDGRDTASTLTLEDVLQEAKDKAVPVFTVAIDRGRPEDKDFIRVMDRLAHLTGGIPYRVEGSKTEKLLEEFQAISELLQWQYKVTYTSSLPGDGKAHTLRVEIYHGGASGYSEQNFAVPRVPLELEIPTLPSGQPVRGQVPLTVSETRGVPLSQVELFLDGVSLARLTSAPFSYSWDTTAVPPGTHTLSARATDVSGNVGEISISVEVLPAVLVQILQPANGAEVSSPCTVQVQVDSLDPLDRVEYRVDAVLVALSDRADAPVQLDLGGFSAGSHRLRVLAVDRAGRQGEAEVSFTLKGGISWYLIAFLGFLGLLILVVVIVVVTRLSRPRPAEVVPVAASDTLVSQVPGGPSVPRVMPPGPVFPPGVAVSPEAPTRPGMPVVAPSDTRVAAPVVGDTIVAAARGRGREPETELMVAAVAAEAWLVGKEGDAAGHQFPLHKERVILGRSSTCDIVLGDPAVSNRHAAIVREGDAFTIQDLASTNGTFVGGERITEPRVLNEGDEIRLGKTVLVFKRL